MTSDEIKQNTSMREIVESYGITINRNNMCSCPWHGEDSHPSMRIYQRSYYCYTCQSGGDVFTWVMQMEKCSFPEAFKILGGEYIQPINHRERILAICRRNDAKDQKRIDQDSLKIGGRAYLTIVEMMEWCSFILRFHRPMSRSWCIAAHAKPEIDYLYELAFLSKGADIDGLYIIEKCRRLEKELLLGSGLISRDNLY